MALGGWIGRWSPGIGDPSAVGWITVAAYFATAWLCWRARAASRREGDAAVPPRGAALWTALTVGLLALGINKQLDLQSAVTEMGRMIVHAGGWEARKRTLQVGFILGVLGLTALAFAWLAWLTRGDLRRCLLPLLGSAELGAFVLIRAASFHHVDILLGQRWAGARVNWILELGGITLIAVGALLALRAEPAPCRTPRPPS
jgi:hypothetical protein